jgi:hypothetical protein
VVSVPTLEQEQNRALIHYHCQIVSDRVGHEARGKELLCTQGIEIRGQWWQEPGWDQVQNHPRLAAKILSSLEEETPLRKRIEALAPTVLPIGVGAYSAAVREYEMRGWG